MFFIRSIRCRITGLASRESHPQAWKMSVARWKGPPERWFCQQHGTTGFAINGTTGLPLMGPPGVASTLSVVWPLYWRHDVSGVIDDRSERDPAAVAGWPVAAGREQAGGGGP